MSNIRLFFLNTLSLGMTDSLDKSQSHYLTKVMRVKENEVFSVFNKGGEWQAKILSISKNAGALNNNECSDINFVVEVALVLKPFRVLAKTCF